MFITLCVYAQQGYVFGCISLCMYSVYVCIYVTICKLFGALPLEIPFWVYSATFSLSLNTSSVVCYIQRAVQTDQFMLSQIRREGPLAQKLFFLSFNGTPHPLGSRAAVVLVVCFSECSTRTATLLYMYAAAFQAQPLWNYSGLEAHAVQSDTNCSAVSLHMQFSAGVCLVYTGCVL